MSNKEIDERRNRPGDGSDRRDYAPPGRLRRIFHDYRTTVWGLAGLVLLLLLLFAGTTAYAVNERFKRDVAEIAYTRDAEAVQFLLEKEEQQVAQLTSTAPTPCLRLPWRSDPARRW
jgi:hypothetical protein